MRHNYFNYLSNIRFIHYNRTKLNEPAKRLTYPKRERIAYNIDLKDKVLEQQSMINILKSEVNQLRDIIIDMKKLIDNKH